MLGAQISQSPTYTAQLGGAEPAVTPRLVDITQRLQHAIGKVRENAAMLHAKATAIAGSLPPSNSVIGGSPVATPAAVPNGAVEAIEVALRELFDAIDDLAAAERRLNGLA